MSNAITMAERKVKALQAEYGELQRERDGAYRGTTWYEKDFERVSQELTLAKARLWLLKQAEADATGIPQPGWRLAYVAG